MRANQAFKLTFTPPPRNVGRGSHLVLNNWEVISTHSLEAQDHLWILQRQFAFASQNATLR